MNSLQTKLLVSALTNTVARTITRDANQPSTYLRVRFSSHELSWSSPEIGYLDANSKARFVSRVSRDAEAKSITTLSRKLAEHHLLHSKRLAPATMTFELEAVEIGSRWCVNIKTAAVDQDTGHKVEGFYQGRVLSGATALPLAA